MSIFDAYHAGRGMVFLLFQSFHSHVWRPAVIPLAFDRRRYQEPPLLPLMVNVLGPKVLEQKVLGPKSTESESESESRWIWGPYIKFVHVSSFSPTKKHHSRNF